MVARSASVRVAATPFLAPARSTKLSIAARALPIAAAVMHDAKNPNGGKRYSGLWITGPSKIEITRSSGTKTSSATVS